MSKRFVLQEDWNNKLNFSRLKNELKRGISKVELDFLEAYIKNTASIYDRSRYCYYCIVGLIPDVMIEAIQKQEVFYQGVSSRDKSWLKNHCPDKPNKYSKYLLFSNINKVSASMREDYICIPINSLILDRAYEADINIKDVYLYINLLNAKDINIRDSSFKKITTGNRGTSFYLQYLDKEKTWELYINEEINRSDIDKIKLKKYYGVFDKIYPNIHKILLMFLCSAIPNSISREGLSTIRYNLDLMRQDRTTIGISDPVVEHHKGHKVACISIYEKNLFLTFSKGSKDMIPYIAEKYRNKLCVSTLIDKSGKYVVVNPIAELSLVPKTEVTKYIIVNKYKEFNAVLKQEFGEKYDHLTLGKCISKYPQYLKYLDEIYEIVSQKVKEGKYSLFDVFTEVSGLESDKPAKYAARFSLVTIHTGTVISKIENLIDLRNEKVRNLFERIRNKEKELRG